MRRNTKVGLLALMCGASGIGVYFMCILFMFGIVGMFCWPYAINTWLVFVGKVPRIQWYHGFGMGCVPFFGMWAIPFTIVTWILMHFLI